MCVCVCVCVCVYEYIYIHTCSRSNPSRISCRSFSVVAERKRYKDIYIYPSIHLSIYIFNDNYTYLFSLESLSNLLSIFLDLGRKNRYKDIYMFTYIYIYIPALARIPLESLVDLSQSLPACAPYKYIYTYLHTHIYIYIHTCSRSNPSLISCRSFSILASSRAL